MKASQDVPYVQTGEGRSDLVACIQMIQRWVGRKPRSIDSSLVFSPAQASEVLASDSIPTYLSTYLDRVPAIVNTSQGWVVVTRLSQARVIYHDPNEGPNIAVGRASWRELRALASTTCVIPGVHNGHSA